MVRRTDKSKAAGVSASSFLDLQAELAQQQTALSMRGKAGESTALVGGVQRPGKVRCKSPFCIWLLTALIAHLESVEMEAVESRASKTHRT